MDFFTFLKELFAVDWTGLIAAAVASGVGLAAVTQLLKTKWVKVPAKKYPRIVTAALAVLVGIISTLAVGLELSSLTSLIVFVVISFIVSGLAYDAVKGLVGEVKESPVTADHDIDHVEAGPESETRIVAKTVNEPKHKTVDEVAQEIIDGKKSDGSSWGNGPDRKTNLEAAGYNYDEVQAAVKKALAK